MPVAVRPGSDAPSASTAYSISTLPAFSNSSVPLTFWPFSSGCFEPHEHHMHRPGLELDRLAGLDLETARDRPHLGDPLLHHHAVDLEPAGDRGRAADEPVGRLPLLVIFM